MQVHFWRMKRSPRDCERELLLRRAGHFEVQILVVPVPLEEEEPRWTLPHHRAHLPNMLAMMMARWAARAIRTPLKDLAGRDASRSHPREPLASRPILPHIPFDIELYIPAEVFAQSAGISAEVSRALRSLGASGAKRLRLPGHDGSTTSEELLHMVSTKLRLHPRSFLVLHDGQPVRDTKTALADHGIGCSSAGDPSSDPERAIVALLVLPQRMATADSVYVAGAQGFSELDALGRSWVGCGRALQSMRRAQRSARPCG